jgi:hypothetical protein
LAVVVSAALFGTGFWLGRVTTIGPWTMMGTRWMMTGPVHWGGWMMWLIPVLLILGLVIGLVILAVGSTAAKPQVPKEQGRESV